MIGKILVRLKYSISPARKSGNSRCDVGIGAQRLRQAGADDRLDLAGLQQLAERPAGLVLLDRHRA